MRHPTIYNAFRAQSRAGKKHFAVLIDPDELNLESIDQIIMLSHRAHIDYFLVGGSHILDDKLDECLEKLRKHTDIPLILFPGSHYQINSKADAILFLSLVSSRNPHLLIGQQVLSAPYLAKSDLEVISTAYMLIDGGQPTTVSYMSNSQPIPYDKYSIAVSTAIASEMLGFKQIYMDAGSGAQRHIQEEMIERVRNHIEIPIIIGGGIRTPLQAEKLLTAGADLIVVGNAIEKDPDLLIEMSEAINALSNSL